MLGALWWIGAGLGWFGEAAGPEPVERRRDAPSAASAAPPPTSPPAVSPSSAPAASSPDAAPASPPRPPSSQPTARPAGIEPDRFESLISLLHAHLQARRLGRADALLARLRAQVGEGSAQADRLDRWARRVAQRRARSESEILAQLRTGDVLAADRLAVTLEHRGAWTPSFALREQASLGADWAAAVSAADLPPPPPLPRRRLVQFDDAGSIVGGAVVRSAGGRTTVRVTGDDGQRFPTVADARLAPVDSTPQEAVDAALRAAHAGNGRLARLWLCRAMVADGPADGRVERVAAALRGQ